MSIWDIFSSGQKTSASNATEKTTKPASNVTFTNRPIEQIFTNKPIEQIAVPSDSAFDLEAFRKAREASYTNISTQKMAIAAYEIAKLIQANFDTSLVRCMVPAATLSADAAPGALPVHFLFYKNGRPSVAVVVVTSMGFETTRVLATKETCERRGIAYLRYFCDGNFADWIEDPNCSPVVATMCKACIVRSIAESLR